MFLKACSFLISTFHCRNYFHFRQIVGFVHSVCFKQCYTLFPWDAQICSKLNKKPKLLSCGKFFSKHGKFSVMYQNLPLCKKHGSYMCRATLRNFPTLLNFVRKIPTSVGTIPTLQEDVLHFVTCVGIFLTKFNSVGIFPTKFCRNSQ